MEKETENKICNGNLIVAVECSLHLNLLYMKSSYNLVSVHCSYLVGSKSLLLLFSVQILFS